MKHNGPSFKAYRVAALRFLNQLESHQAHLTKNAHTFSSSAISSEKPTSTPQEKEKLALSPFWEKVVMVMLLIGIFAIHDEIWCETLEELVDKAHGFVNNKIKTFGLSAATILGCIFALARGSLKMAGVIVLVGIIIAFFLKWVEGGLKLPA